MEKRISHWGEKHGSAVASKMDAPQLCYTRRTEVIAIDGDPTKDVTVLEHVKFVMKGGTVYQNDYTKR
jgi:hypothetical protein